MLYTSKANVGYQNNLDTLLTTCLLIVQRWLDTPSTKLAWANLQLQLTTLLMLW